MPTSKPPAKKKAATMTATEAKRLLNALWASRRGCECDLTVRQDDRCSTRVCRCKARAAVFFAEKKRLEALTGKDLHP